MRRVQRTTVHDVRSVTAGKRSMAWRRRVSIVNSCTSLSISKLWRNGCRVGGQRPCPFSFGSRFALVICVVCPRACANSSPVVAVRRLGGVVRVSASGPCPAHRFPMRLDTSRSPSTAPGPYPSHVLGPAEVVSVRRFGQPAPLTRRLAHAPAHLGRAVALVADVSRVGAEQLSTMLALAASASRHRWGPSDHR